MFAFSSFKIVICDCFGVSSTLEPRQTTRTVNQY